jgi:hypothetical protein
MAESVVVAGALAQMAGQGGLTWVYLQYLLGFRKLGWDVLFIDRLEPEMCTDAAGHPAPLERSVQLAYFVRVMEAFEVPFGLLHDGGREVIGLTREDLLERLRHSAFLLNVMGYLEDEALLTAAQRRVFLDIDPGFGQMWRDLGLADLFEGHDAYVTVGERIGRPDCPIPDCGLDWIPWRQPVVLEEWPAAPLSDGRFTSVGSWRGPNAPIEWRGQTYGLRVHEFRKFLELPRRVEERFEVALDIHNAEERDLAALAANGWSLVDPAVVASDPWTYRDYIRGSRAEFMPAKGLYVQTRSGWFSDRSVCYLASGRPVLVQDTGLSDLYPVGEGLLTFSTLDEATAGVESIAGDYARHARAAREIAETCFDSDVVLTRLAEAVA